MVAAVSKGLLDTLCVNSRWPRPLNCRAAAVLQGMAKSPQQTLLIEALASIQRGRRTVEFERLLLGMFPEKDRELIREALSAKPAFTANTVRLAHAAKKFIESRNQFDNDDQAVNFVAKISNVPASLLRRAGKDRANEQVTPLLREWGLLPKTKG
jgi:hypothetical protein